MSILLGPYDRSATPGRVNDEEEELLVFGYGCKLYRDDSKALLEDSGQLLIPWMGDASLMIDRFADALWVDRKYWVYVSFNFPNHTHTQRYDIRNRLEDKSQFGLKPSIPHKLTATEEELEDELDRERYLSLGVDIREEELREGWQTYFCS